jgi:hypothetical protein
VSLLGNEGQVDPGTAKPELFVKMRVYEALFVLKNEMVLTFPVREMVKSGGGGIETDAFVDARVNIILPSGLS